MANLDNAKEIGFGVVSQGNISTYAPQQIVKSATAPTNPASGDFWFDTVNYAFKFYDGTEWQLIKATFAATGGTISEASGFRYHTFTTSGTFQVTKGSASVDYLIIGGGGGGGTAADSNNRAGGGGGAGGYQAGSINTSEGIYTITIGAGGSGSSGYYTVGNSGGSSSALGLTSLGGGRGGTGNGTAGAAGGSGGGGGAGNNSTAGGAGTAGQGNAGGSVSSAANTTNGYSGGGGGGAGGAGDSAISGVGAIVYGGSGLTWEDGVTRAVGGNSQSGTDGPTDGPANTGNGGKSGGLASYAGGSGIVIIRYPI